jgi:predicted RNase H-like HicB family nuclease
VRHADLEIWRKGLERGVFLADTLLVDTLTSYRRHAMKLAVVTDLGADEGYAARIPGFRGLLAIGRTKKEALAELENALADWIELALKRGIGLPELRKKRLTALTAA